MQNAERHTRKAEGKVEGRRKNAEIGEGGKCGAGLHTCFIAGVPVSKVTRAPERIVLRGAPFPAAWPCSGTVRSAVRLWSAVAARPP